MIVCCFSVQIREATSERVVSLCADWRDHSGYYNCSKYQEDAQEINEARQALEKYLFYYHRVSQLGVDHVTVMWSSCVLLIVGQSRAELASGGGSKEEDCGQNWGEGWGWRRDLDWLAVPVGCVHTPEKGVCVCVCVSERESVCVCEWVRERVCVCVSERESVCVSVC